MKKRKVMTVSTIVLLVSLVLAVGVQAEGGVYATSVKSSFGVINFQNVYDATGALGAPDGTPAIMLDYGYGIYSQMSLDFVDSYCTSLVVHGVGFGNLDISVWDSNGQGLGLFEPDYFEGELTLPISGEVNYVNFYNYGTSSGLSDAYIDAVECVTTAEPTPEFGGFQPPIASDGFNAAKAGRAIPVNFSLGGEFGLEVLQSTSVPIACDGAPVSGDPVPTVSAGASGLTYDPLADLYTYVWKTEKSWSGTCRQLILTIDNNTYYADFKFK
jgi:hypothetical protein